MSTQTAGRIPQLTLGWRLKMALGDRGVQELADALGVHRGTVGRWMRDEGAEPKRAYILQWAMLTGVDAGWLETGKGLHPVDPDGGLDEVRPQGLEPRTRWFGVPAGGADVVELYPHAGERELQEAC